MNVLSKAIDEIKFTIPMKVLVETFKDDRANWRHTSVSIDEMILSKVIRPRVLVDANIVGGQMTVVSLGGLMPEFVDDFTSVYKIPKDRTQGRSIMSLISVGYLPYNYSGGGGNIGGGLMSPNSMSTLMNVGQRIADAVSGIPPISNAYLDLVGENTVLIKDQFRVSSSYFLRCVLGNEENLNNLSPRYYKKFSTLCIFAVKSYIYNTMLVRIDQAYLSGGQELGTVKSVVESYSDMEQMYQDYLKDVWMKVALMNDVHAHTRHIKRLICPGI